MQRHVLLGLGWMRHHAALADLVHDAHVSAATAYCYLHEALDVIVDHAPDLQDVLVSSGPNGHPLRISAVRPGSVLDLRCARELVLPALYPFCRLHSDGHSYLPVSADEGSVGARIGVRGPHRRPSGE